MSEHESTQAEGNPTEPEPRAAVPTAKPAGGMSPLRLALFIILAVMLGALVYDWFIALPAAQAARLKVVELVSESASRPADQPQANREDVQQLVGKLPSDTTDGGHYVVEEYRWMRGLPWQSYFFQVLYNKKEGGKSYTLAIVDELNQEIEPESVPGGPAEVPFHTPPDPAFSDPVADPATSEGATPEPADPGADEPLGGAPPAEESPAEEPAAEAPGAPSPPAEEPAASLPPGEEPVAKEPTVEEPASEEPAAEPAVEEVPAESGE